MTTNTESNYKRFSLNGLKSYWQKLAYHHKTAEGVLWLLFVSGFILWDTPWLESLGLSWTEIRWSLIIHSVLGFIIFPLTTGLFWLAHRRLIAQANPAKNNSLVIATGKALDIILFASFLSGFGLFFYGATGNQAGDRLSDIHWLTGLMLAPVLLRHAWRFSILHLRSNPQP